MSQSHLGPKKLEPIIEVKNLSKTFHAIDGGPRKDLKSFLTQSFSLRPTYKSLSVLESVSFDVYPGEFVAIMGRNGIGKSTILKLISGVYSPTSGSITARGIIAPLLELGSGFNPELSGYENIFLNAAILGFSRGRTLALIDQIIDFSELRSSIYQPVRQYSTGMVVRLGFSIAAHLDAPILLLDEVLGVGDAGFAQKSTEKIVALNREGRTCIVVTHSPELVEKHCSRCILLHNRRVIYDGPAKGCKAKYKESVMSGFSANAL